MKAKIKKCWSLFENFELPIHTQYAKCFKIAFNNIVIPKIVDNYKLLVLCMRLRILNMFLNII